MFQNLPENVRTEFAELYPDAKEEDVAAGKYDRQIANLSRRTGDEKSASLYTKRADYRDARLRREADAKAKEQARAEANRRDSEEKDRKRKYDEAFAKAKQDISRAVRREAAEDGKDQSWVDRQIEYRTRNEERKLKHQFGYIGFRRNR